MNKSLKLLDIMEQMTPERLAGIISKKYKWIAVSNIVKLMKTEKIHLDSLQDIIDMIETRGVKVI